MRVRIARIRLLKGPFGDLPNNKKLITVGVDEHFANGGPEKAVQDIDYMVACIMADNFGIWQKAAGTSLESMRHW